MKRWMTMGCVGLMLAIGGCNRQEPASQSGSSATTQKGQSASDAAADVKAKAIAEYQKQVDALSDEIDQLKAKSKDASADTQAKINDWTAKLESKMGDAKMDLAKLKDSGADAWDKAKVHLQNAMDDVRQAYDSAKSSLSGSDSSSTSGGGSQ